MGLSPSEKKAYNASKRRRKQAMQAYATGKIRPIRSHGRILVFALVMVVLALAGVCVFMFFQGFSGEEKSHAPAVQTAKEHNEQLLQVVNSKNPLERSDVPSLSTCGGVRVNTLMADDLDRMLQSANSKNLSVTVQSGYISYDEQQKLFENQFENVRKNGKYSQVKAEAIASRTVSRAGESEAQLGLLLTFDVSDSAVSAFLEREGIRYGFIRRYPKEKEDITRHDSSEAIYRYVGAENAQKMRMYNMCLEEYIDYQAQ